MAGTAALAALIVLSEQFSETVGLPHHETKSIGKLLVQEVQPAGAGLGVGAGVAQTVEKSSKPLIDGLADARAGLRLIL